MGPKIFVWRKVFIHKKRWPRKILVKIYRGKKNSSKMKTVLIKKNFESTKIPGLWTTLADQFYTEKLKIIRPNWSKVWYYKLGQTLNYKLKLSNCQYKKFLLKKLYCHSHLSDNTLGTHPPGWTDSSWPWHGSWERSSSSSGASCLGACGPSHTLPGTLVVIPEHGHWIQNIWKTLCNWLSLQN